MIRPRLLSAAAALAALAAAPASADTLIGVTDEDPSSVAFLTMSDTATNGAVGWSQAVAATGVSVRVGVFEAIEIERSANWWITTALGPAAGPADVVASGVYTPLTTLGVPDFDLGPMVTLASGLDLGPGDYWLVLDGTATEGFLATNWIGDGLAQTAVTLAPGFALNGFLYTDAPTPFGPAAAFTPAGGRFAFDLQGTVAAVPEPATWTAMLLGFGLLGATLRRRRCVVAVIK